MTVSPFSYGNVLTAGQWAYLFGQKQNALGYTPVNRAGDTMLGPLVTAPSNPNGAGFSVPPGAAPDQPVDGQIWMTIFGLFFQIGGATIGPIANGNIVGPGVSVVGDIATFSTTGGNGLADSGISLGSQAANRILATPGGGAGVPAFRALVGADLPAPQASALGGVKSAAAPAHLFGTGIDTAGNPTFGQPAVGDISGLATNMAAFLIGGTSAQLAAAVGDETGSGSLVFGTNPTVALAAASTGVTQTPGDNSTHLATTAYVQAAIYATTTLPASKYATTAALPAVTYANGASGVGATLTATANGALTVDGVASAVNDVILVKNQASTFQNGIYSVTATGSAGAPFVLTRVIYYNLAADINLGDTTFVSAGSTLAGTSWEQNGTEQPVIGTNPITFAQVAGLGTYTNGNGLALSGTQFSIDTSVTVDKNTAQTLTNKTFGANTALGTPTSGNLANATGLPIGSGVAGLATNMAAFLAGGTSAQLIAAVNDETGTGSLVFGTGPTISLASGSTAVTQAVGDNSTHVATTAFVQAAVTGTRINTQTASYIFALTDANGTVEMNVATANSATVPPNSSVAFPIGTVINLSQIGAGLTTVTAGAGVTIDSRIGLKMGGQFALATLYKRGTDEWVLGGDTSA